MTVRPFGGGGSSARSALRLRLERQDGNPTPRREKFPAVAVSRGVGWRDGQWRDGSFLAAQQPPSLVFLAAHLS
jgi:hypothetical protein